MGDRYRHFLAAMSTVRNHEAVGHPEPIPDHQLSDDASLKIGNSSLPGVNSGQTASPDMVMSDDTQLPKPRRKSAVDGDSFKHRRTRSGCFTCRSRRVKCDEGRPTCARCQKGKRDCVYPEPPSSKPSAASTQPRRASALGNSKPAVDDQSVVQDRGQQAEKVEETRKGENPTRTGSTPTENARELPLAESHLRRTSETPSNTETLTWSPLSSTTSPSSFTTTPYLAQETLGADSLLWTHCSPEVQGYLDWFQTNMTHYHWCMVCDTDDFFKSILPSLASRDEALFNAFVGFIAYLVTLQNPNGKLESFLKYYNRSVSLLLQSIKRRDKHNVATLLTILQLSTIEEYLGDPINLLGHQKAAFRIITKVFTPHTIMQTPVGRMCLYWYSRADCHVAIMGAFPCSLSREWFTARHEYHQREVAAKPDGLNAKMEERLSHWRLINYDLSILVARGTRGQIETEPFNREHAKLMARVRSWRDLWDSSLTDPTYLVRDFPRKRSQGSEDIVNPYLVGNLYGEPLLSTTILEVEYNAILLMLITQSRALVQDQIFSEMGQCALAICQYFETLEFWPHSPPGALCPLQSSITMASLFLPHDGRHQKWVRQKLSQIESAGFLCAASFRGKMAEVYADPTIKKWWWPDEHGFTPVLEKIRSFADERNNVALTAQQEDLAEVKSLFSKLQIYDTSA